MGRMLRPALPFVLLALGARLVEAQESESPSTVLAHQMPAAPVIDGVLDEKEWQAITPFDLRYQTQPGDNVSPSERTEVRIGYTRNHLYVAIRAWDSEPGAMRGRVTRRDDIFGDDYITIHLDTYDDRRRAYVFSFNPLGIQGDGLYNEGVSTGRNWDSNIDRTWDGVLTSAGRLVEDGYVIEAAIPFRTLRYAGGADAQWGLHVQRWIARKGESVSWRPISREVASLLTQMGTLSGLREIGDGTALDLIPAMTTAVTAERRADGEFANQRDFDPGITVNWAVTPNVTFSATANPDFSQIEADVPQIEVNQRFPLRYPEKRPFFLEGGQFFQSPGALNFVETRRIVDPDWGVKATGKSGRNTFAFLAAEDAAPGPAIDATHPAYGDTALVGIARYQRDILQNSTIGTFVTTRRFAGEENTVAAIDGQLRLPLQTFGYQLSRSFTNAQGVSTDGDATYVWYDFVGRHWRLFVNDLRISSDYRADTAFVRRTGIQANSIILGYEFQADQTWWVRVRPFIVARAQRTHDNLLDESYVDPGADIRLARDIRIYTYYSFHRDAFLGREYDYQFAVADYTVNTFKKVSISGRLQIGEAVHFDPARPQVGHNLDSSLNITLKPDARLNSEFLYLKSRLMELGTGRELFGQDVWRNRTNYQFTREHAARSILEYNTLSRRLSVSLLYTFLPQPNTAVYLGYGDLFVNGLDPSSEERVAGVHRLRRAVFLKLSHNFRR
jgi:hypothetical protein